MVPNHDIDFDIHTNAAGPATAVAGDDVRAGCAWVRAALEQEWGEATGGAEVARRAFLATRRLGGARDNTFPLNRLAAIFGLFDQDVDLLILAHAMRHDTEIVRLSRPESGGVLTVGLAQQLVGESLAPRLSPGAPLLRYYLLEIHPGAHPEDRVLMLNPRIDAFLGGEDCLDPYFASRAIAADGAYCPARHRKTVDQMFLRLEDTSPARFVVAGREGSGRRAAAQYIASRLGRGVIEMRPERVPATGDARHIFWSLAAREAALAGLVILLDDNSDHGIVEDAMTLFEGPLVILAPGRIRLPGIAFVVTLEPLAPLDRAECWAAAFGRDNIDNDCRWFGREFGLGPTEISRAVAEAAGNTTAAATIAREVARAALDPLAHRIDPGVRLDDLVVPAVVRSTLDAIVAQVRFREIVHDDWGFRSGAARSRGISALISGRSGVGKTMAAEAVAAEIGADLYRVDLSAVVSKYIGETEKALARIFDAAERSGAVLFIDEADALFGKRTEIRDSRDRWANTGVSYLLQRIEQYYGLCILATNFKSQIDIAFLRRLRFVIDLPFPGVGERAEIWQRIFPPGVPMAAIDYSRLGELEIAGGHIAVIAVNAAFLAAASGKPVGMAHITAAARDEFAKLDKPFPTYWATGVTA
jgi:ATPase family associated with various cellular activities (AAA)